MTQKSLIAADQVSPNSQLSEQPNLWLRELVRLKPAAWPWGHSIRTSLCLALPLGIGVAADATITALWIALGALMASAAEPPGSHRAKLRKIAVATAIGGLGFFAGYLLLLPWIWVVLAMALAGFAAGIASGWSPKISIGAMQFLLLASIAIGVPGDLSFWRQALLFAGGAAFYAVLLSAEALFFDRHPERAPVIRLSLALGELAIVRAANVKSNDEPVAFDEAETARRKVTDALSALGIEALETRSRSEGRSPEADAISAIVAKGDSVFAEILASDDREALGAAATDLKGVATAIQLGESPAPAALGLRSSLAHAVQSFAFVAGRGGAANVFRSCNAGEEPPEDGARIARLHVLLGRLIPGSDVVRSALALALCLGLAYCSRWFIHQEHWFWVPLTVSLIMKPDLGSIFGRAVLRSLGTVGGAVIGAALLFLLPKGELLVAAVAVLAAMLPWSMRVSYALQAVVLTPLVLVLLSAIEPGPVNVDFALERVLDTAIGSIIVLVFGYFIWRRARGPQLASAFHCAKQAIASYLVAVGSKDGDLARRRLAAYGHLSNLRAQLQMLMVEPPPTSREAIAWFPLIAAAERICDRITVFSVAASAQAAAVRPLLRTIATYIAAAPHDRAALPPLAYHGADQQVGFFVAGLRGELRHMARLQEGGTFPNVAEKT